MATSAELRSQLAAADDARNAASALVGPATDAAQQAYDTAAFFDPSGKQFSDNWQGSFNGQTFNDPWALWDAAKADFQQKADKRKELAVDFNAKLAEYNSLKDQVDALPPEPTGEAKTNEEANADAKETPATGVPTTAAPGESATNPSQEDKDTEDKYKNQSATDPGPPAEDDGSDPYVSNGQSTIPKADTAPPVGGVSQKTATPPARAEWPDAKDVRAILKVPVTYLNGVTDPGKVLNAFGGIVFPYTPQISFSHEASYTGVNPTHSNYTQYFYKNSSVSAIQVNARFTVQNEDDAIILVGVLTLLRALTKMKFGPDKDAGAPPPVCRFSAYGNYMLNNVPVTVASFKHDLPDGVDYFQTGSRFKTHGLNFVPVMSTISLTLNPTYSRSEMMRAGVTSTLTGKAQKSGFL